MDIDYAFAKKILLKAALNQPSGYKYQRQVGFTSCKYVHVDENGEWNQTGCIVGNALISAGVVDFDFFKGNAPELFTPLNTCTSYKVVEKLREQGHRVSPKADYFMRSVQCSQDSDSTWERSVLNAIYSYEFGNSSEDYSDDLDSTERD